MKEAIPPLLRTVDGLSVIMGVPSI